MSLSYTASSIPALPAKLSARASTLASASITVCSTCTCSLKSNITTNFSAVGTSSFSNVTTTSAVLPTNDAKPKSSSAPSFSAIFLANAFNPVLSSPLTKALKSPVSPS